MVWGVGVYEEKILEGFLDGRGGLGGFTLTVFDVKRLRKQRRTLCAGSCFVL